MYYLHEMAKLNAFAYHDPKNIPDFRKPHKREPSKETDSDAKKDIALMVP